jgi:hypothetical protein
MMDTTDETVSSAVYSVAVRLPLSFSIVRPFGSLKLGRN